MNKQEKIDILRRAFLKALDVSINSIGESDLQECFGDIKNQVGGALQRIFVNMISKAEARMEDNFDQLLREHRINELLDQISSASSTATHTNNNNNKFDKSPVDDTPDKVHSDALRDVVLALKKSEMDDLKAAIRTLESEIKKSKDIGGRLRTQMYNEVEALNEENLKIKNAADLSNQ